MYDTPRLHLDTSTRLPSFFDTDHRRGAPDVRPQGVRAERRAGERRMMGSVLRG